VNEATLSSVEGTPGESTLRLQTRSGDEILVIAHEVTVLTRQPEVRSRTIPSPARYVAEEAAPTTAVGRHRSRTTGVELTNRIGTHLLFDL
jgi:hypothetical protein